MKKSLYIFIATAIPFFSLTAVAADNWKVVFLHDEGSGTRTGVEFHKNGKKAYGLKFANTDSFMSSIGFMVPLDDYKGKSGQRFIYKGIGREDEKSFNYKDYLIDIKGNDDKRYLLIGSYGGGNRGPYNNGYLIDTKDDFAIVGRVPIGEICNYRMPNEELIFSYDDMLESFSGGAEASVFINYKLQKGKIPQLVEPVGNCRYFTLEESTKRYWKIKIGAKPEIMHWQSYTAIWLAMVRLSILPKLPKD